MKKIQDKLTVYDSAIIQRKIFTIRDNQVMLDSDLADFYGVETRRLNEQVKRNISRFPKEFMFQLTSEEFENLMSQFAISSSEHGGRRKLPYVFTEQGVAMLSGILRSETAVKISIQIMSAFVAMRRFLVENAGVFQRLDNLELRQIRTDEKVNHIFDALQSKDFEPKQGIFFDAHKFVSGLIKKAGKSIILIDNYVDESALDLLTKKKKNVEVVILTKNLSKALKLDAKKFNAQYPKISIKEFDKAHDRFLIIDDKDIYHFGASLKDLGKKWFAFNKFEEDIFSLLENIKKVVVDA